MQIPKLARARHKGESYHQSHCKSKYSFSPCMLAFSLPNHLYAKATHYHHISESWRHNMLVKAVCLPTHNLISQTCEDFICIWSNNIRITGMFDMRSWFQPDFSLMLVSMIDAVPFTCEKQSHRKTSLIQNWMCVWHCEFKFSSNCLLSQGSCHISDLSDTNLDSSDSVRYMPNTVLARLPLVWVKI